MYPKNMEEMATVVYAFLCLYFIVASLINVIRYDEAEDIKIMKQKEKEKENQNVTKNSNKKQNL